jgi:hypothetical protein
VWNACLSIHHQNRPRLRHPAQIVELIALAKRLLAGTLSRALQDGNTVSDLFHNLQSSRCELFRRKYFGEHRLRGETTA